MSRRTALALVVLLTLAAYAPTWRAGFVYEDVRTVLTSGVVQQTEAWHWHTLRSLSTLTFRLNHALDGNNARGYHAVNVLLHVGNGLLLYGIAAALLEPLGALIAASLFLLAPLQSEAVAYISGRTELLSVGSVLLALYIATRRPQWWHPLAILASLCAGLLTKETAAVGFLLVPLVYAMQYADILTDAIRAEWSTLLIWSCGVLVLAVWILWPLRHLGFGTTGSERGYLPYVAIQATAFWRYLAELIVPYGLTIDHDYDLLPHALAYASLAGVAILTGWACWRWRTDVEIAGAWLCVLMALTPRLLVRIPEYLNEHQMYGPMIGLSLVAGILVQRYWPPLVEVWEWLD